MPLELSKPSSNEKAIFEFTSVEWLPNEAEFVCFGLDFGYSADPTAERITEGIKSLAGVIKTEMENRQIN